MSDRFVEFWSQYQPDLREAELIHDLDVRPERYAREPDIREMAEFDRWRARDVLEVGCGIGSDALSFAEAGARYHGIDFSTTAIDITLRRLAGAGLTGDVRNASAT